MRPAPVKDLAASSFRSLGSTENSGWKNNLRTHSRHRPPGGRPLGCAARTGVPEHAAVVFAACGALLEYSQVIFCDLSQHMSRHKPWCPGMCPRVASIGKCRAPRVNDDTLSARHCITECIYSISPGTKVWGSSAGHRSWHIRQPAPQSKLCELHPKGSHSLLCAMTAKSVSEIKLSNKRSAHHFETSVREKGRFYGWR